MDSSLKPSKNPTRDQGQGQFFCSKPFKWFEVAANGGVFLCCQGWLPQSVGNILSGPISDLWNGESARIIRRSILDGSFRYCRDSCPWLKTKSGPVQEVRNVTDPVLSDIIARKLEVLSYGPTFINCAFDRSCNLACPSCRTMRIIEVERKGQILAMQEKLEREALEHAEVLYITGSGDPFGSPYFRSWLKRIRVGDLPSLRAIHLHTNAQLWTPNLWAEFPLETRARLKSTEISIDAASSHTYLMNRKGGDWGRLMKNLEFIARLRRDGPLEFLKIHMVVQANNYAEMPEFVRLGKRFEADRVYFSRLANWGTFTPEEYRGRDICHASHPEHDEFMEVLRRDLLMDPIVDLGNLSGFAPKRGPLQSQKSFVGIGKIMGAMI